MTWVWVTGGGVTEGGVTEGGVTGGGAGGVHHCSGVERVCDEGGEFWGRRQDTVATGMRQRQ